MYTCQEILLDKSRCRSTNSHYELAPRINCSTYMEGLQGSDRSLRVLSNLTRQQCPTSITPNVSAEPET